MAAGASRRLEDGVARSLRASPSANPVGPDKEPPAQETTSVRIPPRAARCASRRQRPRQHPTLGLLARALTAPPRARGASAQAGAQDEGHGRPDERRAARLPPLPCDLL